MKKVYAIIAEHRMPNTELRFQELGRVEFAFTSKSKANEQMDTIHRAIESGEWYINAGHNVVFDLTENDSTFKRTIKVNHPNGAYTFYALQEVCLNSGCFI